MNTKQKCGYMILGAVIGIAGLAVGLCVSPLTAKLDTFDEIVCNRLIITGPDNRNVVLAHAGELATTSDSAALQITGTAHKSGAIVFQCGEYGTSLRVLSKDGKTKIRIGQGEGLTSMIEVLPAYGRGGIRLSGTRPARLSLWNGVDDTPVIDMEAASQGRIQIGGNTWYDSENLPVMTSPMIIMEASSSGSDVIVLGANYNRGVKLTSDTIGVTVYGDDQEPRVTMQNTEQGGRIDVYGKTDDVARVSLGINENGNGAVNTWDKNGYRLK